MSPGDIQKWPSPAEIPAGKAQILANKNWKFFIKISFKIYIPKIKKIAFTFLALTLVRIDQF